MTPGFLVSRPRGKRAWLRMHNDSHGSYCRLLCSSMARLSRILLTEIVDAVVETRPLMRVGALSGLPAALPQILRLPNIEILSAGAAGMIGL